MRPNSVRGKNERRDKGAKRGPKKDSDAKGGRREKSTSTRPKREAAPRAPRPDMPPVDPATVSAAATTFLDGMLKAAGLTGSVTVQQSGAIPRRQRHDEGPVEYVIDPVVGRRRIQTRSAGSSDEPVLGRI